MIPVARPEHDLQIVDSQVHIWGANTPARPWPHNVAPHRPVPFSADAALHEMRTAASSVRSSCRRGGKASAMISHWKRRDHIPRSSPSWASSMRKPPGRATSVNPEELNVVDDIAERHPGLRIAIDHLARRFRATDEAAFPNMDGLVALARQRNVAVKASGMPAYTTDVYPYRRVHAYLRSTYDAFGARRMFWGSDLTKLPCSYQQAVTMFTEEIPWLVGDDLRWVTGRALCEWLGWKV